MVKALIDPRNLTPYNSAQIEDPNIFANPLDEEKYQVVKELVKQVEEIKKNQTKIDEQVIIEVLTVNGLDYFIILCLNFFCYWHDRHSSYSGSSELVCLFL